MVTEGDYLAEQTDKMLLFDHGTIDDGSEVYLFGHLGTVAPIQKALQALLRMIPTGCAFLLFPPGARTCGWFDASRRGNMGVKLYLHAGFPGPAETG